MLLESEHVFYITIRSFLCLKRLFHNDYIDNAFIWVRLHDFALCGSRNLLTLNTRFCLVQKLTYTEAHLGAMFDKKEAEMELYHSSPYCITALVGNRWNW